MSTVGGPRLSTIPTFQNTYSLDFDGVDDYLIVLVNLAVAMAVPFTISVGLKDQLCNLELRNYYN